MAEPVADLWIRFELDPGQSTQHDIANVHRVPDGLERQPVLGEPGQQVESRAVAEREHEMGVRNRAFARQRHADKRFVDRIETGHPAHDVARVRHHVANRRDDLLGKD